MRMVEIKLGLTKRGWCLISHNSELVAKVSTRHRQNSNVDCMKWWAFVCSAPPPPTTMIENPTAAVNGVTMGSVTHRYPRWEKWSAFNGWTISTAPQAKPIPLESTQENKNGKNNMQEWCVLIHCVPPRVKGLLFSCCICICRTLESTAWRKQLKPE